MTDTLNGLFEHGLREMYYVEQQLTDTLETLSEEVDHDDIAEEFRDHREKTQSQIDRLEQVFEQMGVEPEGIESKAIQGLESEHQEFVEQDPQQDVHNLFDLAAAQKTEHLEIAAYGNLTYLANRLGHDEAADLLEENLREEQDALETLSELTEHYDLEEAPME
ncbi:ferritin-like domain-containing protein [Haloferacaceae archaeon DSL9]